jgi:hypothetical protein
MLGEYCKRFISPCDINGTEIVFIYELPFNIAKIKNDIPQDDGIHSISRSTDGN